jgi:hypothetical protein
MALPPRKIDYDDVYGPINAADVDQKADFRAAILIEDPPETTVQTFLRSDHGLGPNDRPMLRVFSVDPITGTVTFDIADTDLGTFPAGADYAVIGSPSSDPTNLRLLDTGLFGGGGSFTAATAAEAIGGTNNTKGITALALSSQWLQGTAIASAATITIPDTGAYFHITGTTAITDVDFTTTTAGRAVTLVFDGILTFTHNATNLINITGASITTAAGDTCVLRSEGGDIVRMIGYTRKDGTALVGGGGGFTAASTLETLTGTENAKGVTPLSLMALWKQGSAIASAGTLVIGDGGLFHVTGTTTITDIDLTTTTAGRHFTLIFDAALTLTHNATTLILRGGQNILTEPGDAALFYSEGGDNVVCIAYFRAAARTLPLWLPAGAWTAQPTNGATPIYGEMTTNKQTIVAWAFDSGTQQYIQLDHVFPKGWTAGTVSFIPVWTHPATTTNFGAVFDFQGISYANADTRDVAWGTAVTSTDTGGTTNAVYFGPASAGATIAGSPVAFVEMVKLRVGRAVANGSDTMAVDAYLEGVILLHSYNALLETA